MGMKTKVTVIAEAGVNHNGDMKLALQLIDMAAKAGCDIVKFQTYKTEELVSPSAKMADYQKKNTGKNISQFELLKKLELSAAQHKVLIAHCKRKKIEFLSTPFDIPSIDLLASLKIKRVKIPSGEINNTPYLRHLAGKFKQYIISTGMSDMEETAWAVNELLAHGVKKNQLVVLHCNTEYPTPYEQVHLNAMLTIKENLGVEVGYSDHTLGIEIAVAAVALGACIIEKHITIDRNMPGPDHIVSLEQAELTAMVKAIRHTSLALGDRKKLITISATKNKSVAKKSIVAKAAIKKGEAFSEKNLTVKRPGTGINPRRWDEVLATKAKRNYKKDELITI